MTDVDAMWHVTSHVDVMPMSITTVPSPQRGSAAVLRPMWKVNGKWQTLPPCNFNVSEIFQIYT